MYTKSSVQRTGRKSVLPQNIEESLGLEHRPSSRSRSSSLNRALCPETRRRTKSVISVTVTLAHGRGGYQACWVGQPQGQHGRRPSPPLPCCLSMTSHAKFSNSPIGESRQIPVCATRSSSRSSTSSGSEDCHWQKDLRYSTSRSS